MDFVSFFHHWLNDCDYFDWLMVRMQVILLKCICEPGRNRTAAEECAIRVLISVLSSEESTATGRLSQPMGVGRKPNNVSADSMLVTPHLRPTDLVLNKPFVNYIPPPKGHRYIPSCILKTFFFLFFSFYKKRYLYYLLIDTIYSDIAWYGGILY